MRQSERDLINTALIAMRRVKGTPLTTRNSADHLHRVSKCLELVDNLIYHTIRHVHADEYEGERDEDIRDAKSALAEWVHDDCGDR